ncbi:MAG TPA: cobalt transporter CbiM [Anaerolineales bacterium]|nr:cobalt transporter CbiM [Anaerolineales bacterium]
MLASPVHMHIPDGFLTPAVAALGWALAIVMIVVALRQTRRQLDDRMVPMMGVLAAFIFAAQAINFPVAAGTSGHLIGAALAAIVLGPWAAMLIMTSVLAVQGLLFQDGGLLVMGWNILNMGVIAGFSGYFAYRLARRWAGESRVGVLAASFAAGWISVVLAAVACAIELAASGTSPLALAVAAMGSVHALIGLGEGAITAAAIGLLLATRPELLKLDRPAPGLRTATLVLIGLGAALLVAAFSPLASPSPDGLEAVARRQGFLGMEQAAPFHVLPGYTVPFIAHPALTTVIAVMIGTLVVFGGAVVVGRLAARRGAASS